VEGLDGLDPEPLEVRDHALVVDDLAEGMGRLARGAGLLGLVDRLAHAVAEAGSPGDPDLPDGSHDGSIIACRPRNPDPNRPLERPRRSDAHGRTVRATAGGPTASEAGDADRDRA